MQYKLSEWTNGISFYCGNVDDLGNNSGYWLHLARVWQLTPADFIKLLVDTYKVDRLKYTADSDTLIFSWNNYSPQHKFLLDTNKMARKVNYQI